MSQHQHESSDQPQSLANRPRRRSTAAFYIEELDAWASSTTLFAWLRWRSRRRSGASGLAGAER